MKKKLFIIALCTILFTGCSLSKKDAKEESYASNNSSSEKNVKEESYASKCTSLSGIVDVDTSKYTNIFDYILEQEDIKVIVKYWINQESADQVKQISKELSSEDATKFLNNMKSHPIDINYNTGLGGSYVQSMDIKYVRNGEEKYINIFQAIALSSSNDINIFKIIDDNAKVIDANYGKNISCNYTFDGFDKEAYEKAME